jgi:hypothetical protein
MIDAQMNQISKILGAVCVVLTAIMWPLTLMMDPTPSSIGAAGSLTVIVALAFVLSLWE